MSGVTAIINGCSDKSMKFHLISKEFGLVGFGMNDLSQSKDRVHVVVCKCCSTVRTVAFQVEAKLKKLLGFCIFAGSYKET